MGIPNTALLQRGSRSMQIKQGLPGQLTPFAPMWIRHCEQEISNTNANNCKQQKYSNPMMILT
ncbi:unnamed protein product [Prunus armeniaca]